MGDGRNWKMQVRGGQCNGKDGCDDLGERGWRIGRVANVDVLMGGRLILLLHRHSIVGPVS
jgi:hypothetical protein